MYGSLFFIKKGPRCIVMRDAVLNLISRRTYLEEVWTEDEIGKIMNMILQANRESGLNIEFLQEGRKAFNSFKHTYGMFKNANSILLLKGGRDDNNLQEKAGYYGESLVLDLTDMRLGTCWIGGTYDWNQLTIKDSEELVCVILVGHVNKLTIKEKFLRTTISRRRKSIGERTKCDGDMPEWMIKGMKSVMMAPSAVNSQKPFFELRDGKVYASVEYTYAMDLIDLGIAKKHFEQEAEGKFEFGNPGVFVKAYS